MDNVLVVAASAVPYLLALLLAAGVVIVGVLGLQRPWLVVLPFLTALFWLSENRYGRLDLVAGPTLLSRGAGVLVFPAYLWAMLVAVLWTRMAAAFQLKRPIAAPPMPRILPWLAAWGVLLAVHVVVALLNDVPLRRAVAPAGFSYLPWLGVLVVLMTLTIRDGLDARRLAWFIIVMGLARAAFGLVRFAAFGGDPANAYANRHGLALKLTFFDINDSLLCLLAMALALLMLSRDTPRQRTTLATVLLWSAVLLPALCIVLSFRRTAWLGTVLALCFLLLQLPAAARWRVLLLGSPVLLAGMAYAAWRRLSQTDGAGGFLFDLLPRSIGPESLRLLELKLAWRTLLDNPLAGVGSWGGYEGWRQISWQYEYGEGGAGTYLHSGLLHLALKTGLVGVVLIVGTVLTLVFTWRRLRRTLPEAGLPLAAAGVAGLLFTVPDWLVGTPVPQIRTMLMFGLCLALPFVAERCFAPIAQPVSVRTKRTRYQHAPTLVRPSSGAR